MLKKAPALILLLIAAVAVLAAAPSEAQVKAKVDALLSQMTLEEKIGQLAQIGGMSILPGAPKPEDILPKGVGGSVLWVSKAADINRLQKIAVEKSRLHIPAIFGLDVVHGYRTIFPMPLAMAASWDMAMIERVQSVAAREARSSGIAWTFAPMVDIARDPRWGRLIEGAGEDPYLGAAVARAQVRGFQGDDLSSPDRLLACAKHFAGYGAAEGGRDYDSAYIPEDQLWNVYLPPFKAALDAGVATFMSAYTDLNDVPATGNTFLLQDVLRQAWRFSGFVVSDAFAVRDLTTHGFARNPADAAYRAFTAGVDMDMASGLYLDHLPALVKEGRISVSALDAAVRPILAAKFRLGLFEHPYVDETRAARIVGAPENRREARTAAQRSAVLLRNEGALLPLARDTTKAVAVIGPLADTRRDLLTMWSGFDLDPSKTVTIFEGIRNKLGANARVEYAPGVQISKVYSSMFEALMGVPKFQPWSDAQSVGEYRKAIDLAKRSDVVVLALGELAMMSGEYASQSSLELPGKQQQLLEEVAALGKPVALVLVNGRPLDIRWASAHVPAILEVWHPGTEGGNAVADLLFGDAVPGGKLPVTWPLNAGQIPIYYAHNLTHQPDTAPQFKSRYWDVPSKPLYPFGYGLSYTRFTISNLKLESSTVKPGQKLGVSVDVANAGSIAGDEVVQLYIHQQAGRASRPVRQLKGFERIALKPGEKKTVQFTLGKDELSYWSPQDRKWIEESETFDVWAGTDSNATLHTTFKVQ